MRVNGRIPDPPAWAVTVHWEGEDILVHSRHLLVQFNPAILATEAAITGAAEAFAALLPQPLESLVVDATGLARFLIPENVTLQSVLDRASSVLASLADAFPPLAGAVSYVAPDCVHTMLAAPQPNDTFAGDWPYRRIAAAAGWELAPDDDPRITIGIIDSGIVMNDQGVVSHPDLDPTRFELGTNFITKGATVRDDNQIGHGTMVSGIVAATRDNGRGIPGMTRRSRIHICKTLDAAGHGTESNFRQAVIELIQAAHDSGSKLIVNYSAGGLSNSKLLTDACSRIQQSGHLLCAAAGDDNQIAFPARLSATLPCVIAVGGSDQSDRPVGPSGLSCCAPASDVRSTKPNTVISGDDYNTGTGTSIAAPFVAGLAALIWSKRPAWTAAQVKQRIFDSVDVTPACRVINMAAALS